VAEENGKSWLYCAAQFVSGSCMAVRKSKKAPRRASPRKSGIKWRSLLLKLVVVSGLLLLCGALYLDARVRYTFAERKWAVPARVYARPLELYQGKPLSAAELTAELEQLGYRSVSRASQVGEYSGAGGSFRIYTRGFHFWDGEEEPDAARLRFKSGQLAGFESRSGSALLRLEPMQIGSIYPAHNEDRILVKREDVPQSLVDMLVAMEDRNFYQHFGIAPLAIARAAWVNLRAGEYQQGGSTLTQQLVKNYYLTPKRSLGRKLVEAVMAISLDFHYSKDEILEGYINEIFLGQDGPRAIHGFGLASQYYFNQPLKNLQLPQLATLVALVRGPSYYDPWRHPQRAVDRRNLVLASLQEQGFIDPEAARLAQLQPLGVGKRYAGSRRRYPAYLDLVRRQLQADYRAEDLSSEGLMIFTNLDPIVQQGAEQSLARVIKELQASRQGLEDLQGAVVLGQPETGAVLAVVGGRDGRYAGFNRALDAQRPIGSLVKPAVYLTALATGRYTLATLLEDQPITVKLPNGSSWSPQNFDKKSHGEVPLFVSLAKSYNQATTSLGMDVGVSAVIDTLGKLGVERELPEVPSLLLGAGGLSVLEVAQYYQTIASDGFYTPLQAIRAVTSGAGERLSRYDIAVEQRVDAKSLFLLQAAMEQTAEWGTGKGLRRYLPQGFTVAVKTGTSDGQRDSWFAGYSGDLLGVSWLGNDDNSRTPITGGSGALRVWGDIFRQYSHQPLQRQSPAGVEYLWIDGPTGQLSGESCPEAHLLPFVAGSGPTLATACGLEVQPKTPAPASEVDKPSWLRRLFGN
jgi:penicillin-binding protein 1B